MCYRKIKNIFTIEVIMSSPFVVSPISYGDLPQGGVLTPMVVAARAPSNTIDIQYTAGYLWLDSLDLYQIVAGVPVYGTGSLYYQAGNSLGKPNWVLISDLVGPVEAVVGTTNQITVVTSAGTATISIPSVFIAPGSIAATTTLTATLGNITATNGNLVLGSAGNKLVIHATTAASDSVGTTAAMTSGAVTITSTAITAASKIIYSRDVLGTVGGNVAISAQSVGSATLTSDAATETSTFNYLIIN